MLRLEHSPPSHVFKYRDRVTIIIDILNSIRRSRQGKKKTQIMQSANLNYGQMKRYLDYLTNQGFLEVNGRRTYVLTSKGSEFLSVGETQKINSVT
ncbi:MAG: winged helix-turn-helix domain-containing protein [Candidatus Bathyarchaeota archaeon]